MSDAKTCQYPTPVRAAVDEESSIIFVPVDKIRPNRSQPRNRFDTNTMIRLADSVRRYGILQPLTVRLPVASNENVDSDALRTISPVYELIAGERRLRAAKLAGLTHVPCVLARADDHLSAELAIIENILREDLNMFEQARAFGRLIVQFSLTQEQVARKMSMSQSAIANKLRLLRLSDEEQREILAGGLTERHARALLRLPADENRKATIHKVIEHRMNVANTERYIDALLEQTQKSVGGTSMEDALRSVFEPDPEAEVAKSVESCCKKKLILKDLRVFYNSIEHAVEILKQTGIASSIEHEEEEDRVVIRILVETSERYRMNVSRETHAGDT